MKTQTAPASPEDEKAILGCFLMDPPKIGQACQAAGITADHFQTAGFGDLYDFMVALWGENEPFDIVTVTRSLSDSGLLDKVGGAATISELFTLLPTTANHPSYVETLKEKRVLRKIIEHSTRHRDAAYASQDDVEKAVADVQRSAAEIAETWRWHKAKKRTRAEIVANIMDAYRHGAREELVGRPTGIPSLDAEIGGLGRKELIVIAGGWSSGKSSITLQIADQWESRYNERVAYFTFDDPEEALVRRLIQMRSRVNLADASGQRELDDDSPERVEQAAQDAASSRIEFIDDIAAHRNVTAVCATARAMHAQERLGMVILDFDEQVKEKGRNETDEQALANIAVALKNLALELDCPVILLSQVTTDEKTGKVVTRGSAAKLQAAKKALLIVRGEREDRRTIRIWKNKEGRPGETIDMGFHGKTFRFYELTEQERTAPPNTAKKK